MQLFKERYSVYQPNLPYIICGNLGGCDDTTSLPIPNNDLLNNPNPPIQVFNIELLNNCK